MLFGKIALIHTKIKYFFGGKTILQSFNFSFYVLQFFLKFMAVKQKIQNRLKKL